jgi:hypothetical protein
VIEHVQEDMHRLKSKHCIIFYKGLGDQRIWIPIGSLGTNPQQLLRYDYILNFDLHQSKIFNTNFYFAILKLLVLKANNSIEIGLTA